MTSGDDHHIDTDAIRAALRPMEERREAARMLRNSDTRRGVFLLLRDFAPQAAGAWLPFTAQSDGVAYFSLSAVENAPDLFGLSAALRSDVKMIGPFLGSTMPQTPHELFISEDFGDLPALLNLSHIVLYALRIRSNGSFAAIAWSDRPWSTVAAYQDEVHADVIPEEWMAGSDWDSAPVEVGALEWLDEYLLGIVKLYAANAAFRLAFDQAGAARFAKDARTATASIWSGIEAIFGVSQELTFRISHYLSVLLGDSIEQRLALKSLARRLYASRSRAVHGSGADEAALRGDAQASWRLLAEALCRIIERGEVPSGKQYDDAVSGARLWTGSEAGELQAEDSDVRDP